MKLRVAVLFGGRAPEHEVSIITGIQVLHALKSVTSWEVLPIYVTKEGDWVKGDDSFFKPETFKNQEKAVQGKKKVYISHNHSDNKLLTSTSNKPFSWLKGNDGEKVDVFFPAFHGKYGEDGCVQGLFELADVAYVGCGVQASAIGMDKIISKRLAGSIGIPVLPGVLVDESEWFEGEKKVLKRITSELEFPMFVKPARLGSSIGIAKVNNKNELNESIKVAFHYDSRVVVEKGMENTREVNISLLGNHPPYQFSATELPISEGGVLLFEDKYLSTKGPSKGMASARREVPAPISKKTERKIKEYSEMFFKEIGGQGIARVDFFIDENEENIYFNEINTMPGSVAFFLWKEAGLDFGGLVKKLVELALERKKNGSKKVTIFESNILEGFNEGLATKV